MAIESIEFMMIECDMKIFMFIFYSCVLLWIVLCCKPYEKSIHNGASCMFIHAIVSLIRITSATTTWFHKHAVCHTRTSTQISISCLKHEQGFDIGVRAYACVCYRNRVLTFQLYEFSPCHLRAKENTRCALLLVGFCACICALSTCGGKWMEWCDRRIRCITGMKRDSLVFVSFSLCVSILSEMKRSDIVRVCVCSTARYMYGMKSRGIIQSALLYRTLYTQWFHLAEKTPVLSVFSRL